MSTKFFTNEGANTLLKKFEGVFAHNTDIEFFDALVGYFRASGYFSVRPFLGSVPHIRILVGINVDEIVAKYQSKGLLFKGDAHQTVNVFAREIKKDIQSAAYERRVEDGIVQFVDDMVSEKIEIRAHPEKNLHAKIYIFRPASFNEHKSGSVITGSSNLTDAGLGAKETANYEFNVLLRDYEDVKFATGEFEKLWKEAVPILPVEVGKLKKETFLNDGFTPYEVYIKFLIEYFGKSVEFDPSSVSDLPKGFMRLTYQVDAVNQGFELLRRHNGFFLADVVGLGKTVVATLVAKKFFYTNGYPSHVSRMLVVVPPALKDNWQETLDKFGLPNYKIITNGSLHKITDPRPYDLVIVDEAHKFRNDTAGAYDQLQRICKAPTRRQLPDGSFARKKVMLVSATPLNNRPDDIRNQVFLFQDGKDSTLEIANLQRFFSACSDAYEKAKKLNTLEEVQNAVREIYDLMREKVVKPLTVRRTRTDLMEHDEYASDLKAQGILFPEVLPPEKILYELDAGLDELYDQTMHLISDPQAGLTYNRYRAIQYLLPSKKANYTNADLLSTQLAKIMKTLLVKRIDSSFHAFKQSLHRFYDASVAMLTMFANGRVYIAPNLNVTEFIVEEREDELIDLIQELQDTDPTIQICKPDDFEPEFIDGLQHDVDILKDLVARWNAVEQDPKLETFIRYMEETLFDAVQNPNKKLIVFSEAKDTTDYLHASLRKHGYNRLLCVDAGNRHSMRETVKRDFDANCLLADQKHDYDIIITTEVLAEGVNLHRANVVVNYDTPWNSTRLMQRIGRVNRIGSHAPAIHNYIFYPTAKVDDDIELRKKALMKLQAFHSALGEDSQIYSRDEHVENFGLFEKNPEEERDEHLVYLMELRKFKEQHPEQFRIIKNMPLRARTGRKDKTKDQTTLCFIRNQRRDAFYFVRKDGGIEELTFVECARQFKAEVPEAAIPLHELHHDQVAAAVDDFADKLKNDAVGLNAVDAHQNPHEKKALAFMSAFLKLPITGEVERHRINAAKKAVKLARFQNLQRDVNKLQKNIKKAKMGNVEILDALMKIINRYPLDELDESLDQPITVQQFGDMKPEIILSKLDPGNERWLQTQLEKLDDVTMRDELERNFRENAEDYGRKLCLIENCIYGVDIQPIACQISKLRFFISLLCDQIVNPDRPNLGIRPLPNLETKFVAANTLVGIDRPEQMLLRNPEIDRLEKELAKVRREHFKARTPKTKQKYRELDDRLRHRIGDLLVSDGWNDKAARQVAEWNPYDQNASAPFFDPEWMFGLADGFDLVIGNPPYVRQEDIKECKPAFQKNYSCYTGAADLFVYFFERGVQLLKMGGVQAYICSNKYFRAGYGKPLRQFLADNMRIRSLIDFGDAPVFEATAYPSIVVMQKVDAASSRVAHAEPVGGNEAGSFVYNNQFLALNWTPGDPVSAFVEIFKSRAFSMKQSYLAADGWQLENPHVFALMQKLRNAGKPLGEYVEGKFYYGIKTGYNEAFVIDRATRDRLVAEDPNCASIIKPFLRGRDVKRWRTDPQDLWLIFTRRGIDISSYPAVKKYLGAYRNKLMPGVPGGRKPGSYEWYEVQDNIAYWQEFDGPKIVYPDIARRPEFTFDEDKHYLSNTLYLIPCETKWLLGVLNSTALWWFYNQISPTIRGGFVRYIAQYVSQIPIPSATPTQQAEIEGLVEQILALKKENPDADVSALETKIDRLVYNLYNLTDEEIKIVEGDAR